MLKFSLSTILFLTLIGCYSFTGGSVPEHLKTIYIAPIEDISGFGYPVYRDQTAIDVTQAFRNNGSLELVDFNGNATLTVKISRIQEQVATAGGDELEDQRKISVTLTASYFDNVKNKAIFENQSFSNFELFELDDPQARRDEAVFSIINQLSNDIVIAVVSGW